jgi:hypothetical protein
LTDSFIIPETPISKVGGIPDRDGCVNHEDEALYAGFY